MPGTKPVLHCYAQNKCHEEIADDHDYYTTDQLHRLGFHIDIKPTSLAQAFLEQWGIPDKSQYKIGDNCYQNGSVVDLN